MFDRPISNLLLACLLLTLIVMPARADDASRLSIQAWVDIDASGNISELEWITELPASLRAATEEKVRAVTFTPAKLEDGTPAASRSELRGSLIMSPDADKVIVTVERLRVSAGVNRLHQAGYPTYALRQKRTATVLAEFTVTVDGKAEDIAILPANLEEDFGQSIRDSLAEWRFEPERLRNSPVASSLCVPFTFSMDGRPAPPEPDATLCSRERTMASMPGQSPLWETIGVSAKRRAQ